MHHEHLFSCVYIKWLYVIIQATAPFVCKRLNWRRENLQNRRWSALHDSGAIYNAHKATIVSIYLQVVVTRESVFPSNNSKLLGHLVLYDVHTQCPGLKIWRHTSRLVNYARSWPCGLHIFPDVQLWPWLVTSVRASKRDVRSSDLQHNVSNEIPWMVHLKPVCIGYMIGYRQGTSPTMPLRLTWRQCALSRIERFHTRIHTVGNGNI